MNAKDFCDWMKRMDLNNLEAAAALGVNRNTVPRYKKEGTPLYIDLACAALSYGLKPMGYVAPQSPDEDMPENVP